MKLILLLILSLSCASTSKKNQQQNQRFQALKAEGELGKRVAVRILEQYPRWEDAKAQAYISSLGRSAVHRLGRQELYYYFAILKSAKARSFAAPGGFIFVTTGLIQKLNSEAQLVGILAREIAHINRKHLMALTKKEQDRAKAANKGFQILDKGAYLPEQSKKAEADAVLGLMSMSYNPKVYLEFAKNKKFVTNVIGRLKVTSASQKNNTRFKTLKNRL